MRELHKKIQLKKIFQKKIPKKFQKCVIKWEIVNQYEVQLKFFVYVKMNKKMDKKMKKTKKCLLTMSLASPNTFYFKNDDKPIQKIITQVRFLNFSNFFEKTCSNLSGK